MELLKLTKKWYINKIQITGYSLEATTLLGLKRGQQLAPEIDSAHSLHQKLWTNLRIVPVTSQIVIRVPYPYAILTVPLVTRI